MSCISRAMRRRSSATARSAAASRASSARRAVSCSASVRRVRVRRARASSQIAEVIVTSQTTSPGFQRPPNVDWIVPIPTAAIAQPATARAPSVYAPAP